MIDNFFCWFDRDRFVKRIQGNVAEPKKRKRDGEKERTKSIERNERNKTQKIDGKHKVCQNGMSEKQAKQFEEIKFFMEYMVMH